MALELDPARSALIIQDLQNDVIGEGGAFAESGAPAHAQSQNVVENVKSLAAAARKAGMAVIHVHYIVEEGAPGLKLNAPLFQGVAGGEGAGARELGRRRGGGARTPGGRSGGREDAHERVPRHAPRDHPQGARRWTPS